MARTPAKWKQEALRRAHAHVTAVQRRQKYTDMGRIQMMVGERFITNAARAAALRGMTLTAYSRRAVAAFVAADLGIPFTDMTTDVVHPEGPRVGSFDPGTGHGTWVASAFADDTDGIQGG